MSTPAQPKKAEVRLDPGVQARLLEQMREEQAASQRTRQLRRYGLLPATFALMVLSASMWFSDDSTTSMIGAFLAQSIIIFVWMIRKRAGSVFGLS